MRMNPKTFCTAVLLAVASTAQSQNPHYPKSIEEKIHDVETHLAPAVQVKDSVNFWTLAQRMNYYNVPGLTIAVIHNYKIEWARGYGVKDKTTMQPVTTKTLFQAGSVSKSLNAMGILKLAQEKKIDLYADINNYLASWKFPYDSVAKGKKITIAELLSHTAGLTIHGFPGYGHNDSIPALPQILDGVRPANTAPVRSQFEPGLHYQYSGGGITISQLIVEDVTHQPYDVYMRDNVLRPLDMTMSSFAQPPLKTEEKYLATGYRKNGQEVDTKYHIYPEQAAAGLWTNPTDLGKYIIATQLSLEGKSNKVLSQKMTALRLTPYIDKYSAFGVFIEKHDDEKYFGHDGSDAGFTTTYKGSFDSGNGVVVMVNSDNGAILNEVVNSVASVYGWKDFYQPVVRTAIRLPGSLLKKYEGSYAAGNDTAIITAKADGIYLSLNHQQSFHVFFSSDNNFFTRELPFDFQMESDDDGNVKDIYFKQGQQEIRAKRL